MEEGEEVESGEGVCWLFVICHFLETIMNQVCPVILFCAADRRALDRDARQLGNSRVIGGQLQHNPDVMIL